MRIVKGKLYQVVSPNAWIRVGEIVEAVNGNEPRFLVKWSQTVSKEHQDGKSTIVGYDPINWTYQLRISANDVKLYKPQPTEIVMNDEELEELQGRIANQEPISASEYMFLSQDNNEPDDYVQPEDDYGTYYHTDNLKWCEVSEEYYQDDSEFVCFHGHRGMQGLAHVDSLDNGAFFYCERSCDWWSNRRYSSMYIEDIGETWCYDEYSDDVYYCEESDSYYTSSDEAPETDRIPGYHSQSRNWRVPDGITLGVELEVYVEDACDAYANRNSEIIGERDGSLDDTNGIEFIGPPMNYDRYFKMDNPWKRTLEAINDAGVNDEQDDGYGMHISVGRACVSQETQARFVLFINCCQDFSEFIAQRGQNRWAEYDKKDPHHVSSMMTMASTGDCWGTKYSATHVDRHRIEVRIFRSVTDPKLFQKNVDYVMSALEYADTHLFVEDMMSVSNYLAWLSTQDKYQALKDFIGEDGSKFADEDTRRKQMQEFGFIIEETNQPPTI
jgi:hypothetical protein